MCVVLLYMIIRVYISNPSAMIRMQHVFQAVYKSEFYFRFGEKTWIHIFARGISAIWNCFVEGLNHGSWIHFFR